MSMMRVEGIYALGLSETRRRSGIYHVGGGFTLIISQNEKFPFLGGTGFLLSPAATEAFRDCGSKLWYPGISSGRHLDIDGKPQPFCQFASQSNQYYLHRAS